MVNQTTDIDVISTGSCGTLLAVAVGGGGATIYDAGSGSGYVEYANISSPSSQLRAEVGRAQQSTTLTDMSDGSTILSANPGGDGISTDGGDGYSGGGADYSGSLDPGGDGGSDGGDGDDSISYFGGRGSGLNLADIPLRNVVIR